MPDLVALIDPLKKIMQDAGEAILKVYQADTPITVESKADNSPVTQADHAAHLVIESGLRQLDTQYPILSEEGGMPDFEERNQWERYWLVDPLDGTKEFINKNGEFTVNIALIEGGTAILGLVYVPVKDTLYYGGPAIGAWKQNDGEPEPIKARPVEFDHELKVVGSRRHGAEALESLLERIAPKFAGTELVSMGSSLKICALAEGSADWYPRLALTSEWDTAAAHAVLLGAGGEIMDENMEVLRYNQKADILNPFFHGVGDKNFDWPGLIRGK